MAPDIYIVTMFDRTGNYVKHVFPYSTMEKAVENAELIANNYKWDGEYVAKSSYYACLMQTKEFVITIQRATLDREAV